MEANVLQQNTEKPALIGRHTGSEAEIILLLAVALWATGCTGAKIAQNGGGGSPDHITQQEIRRARGAQNAYALVQRLQPNWLRKRGQKSITQPTPILVYVDGSRYGTPQDLRNISVTNIASMEWLSASQATTRYGTGHVNGAILVHTKGGG